MLQKLVYFLVKKGRYPLQFKLCMVVSRHQDVLMMSLWSVKRFHRPTHPFF